MNKNELYTLINTMAVPELKELKDKIDLLLFSKMDKDEPPTVELFYDCIKTYLRKQLNMDIPPYYAIRKATKTFPQLIAAHDAVNTYLDGILEIPTRQQKLLGYSLYAKLIIPYVVETPALSPGLNTILACHRMYPILMERAFPSYLVKGLADLIFKAEESS